MRMKDSKWSYWLKSTVYAFFKHTSMVCSFSSPLINREGFQTPSCAHAHTETLTQSHMMTVWLGVLLKKYPCHWLSPFYSSHNSSWLWSALQVTMSSETCPLINFYEEELAEWSLQCTVCNLSNMDMTVTIWSSDQLFISYDRKTCGALLSK